MVGTPYTNDPIALTDEELNMLPTIILQFKGDASNREIEETGKAMPLAKDLDPENPFDVLLAVAPSHYLEYQEDKGMYVPGFYFDEPEGSVLGANVMMLHDIFFDVEQYRIGWVESPCDYTQLVAPFLEKRTTTTDAAPGEPYHEPHLRIRPADNGTIKTPVLSNLSFSRVRRGSCSSATCQISVAISMIVGALAAVWVALYKRNPARTLRRASHHKPAAAVFKVRPSPAESDSDTSITDGSAHFLSKDFSRGIVLRSRSTQIVV
jgi:hypothetical protein